MANHEITMLGWPEILLILGLMLLIFGPSKLPEMARSLGLAFREFQNATANIEKEAKAMTDSLPDLNAPPMGMTPTRNILRKPLDSRPAPQAAPTSVVPAQPQPAAETKTTNSQSAAVDTGNLADVAKMLGISTEGKTEEDLKTAIHDKIEGLDKKEV